MSTPATPTIWGWNTPARVLLSMVAGSAGLALVSASPSGGRCQTALPALVVDPNTAPAVVLSALPRLGPSLVNRLVAERTRAPFRSLDDLDARVRGIGPTTIEALRPHLTFTAPEANERRAALSGTSHLQR